MNKLEEAANTFADEHGFRVPYNVSGRETTNDDYYDKVDIKASKDGFIAGAEWKKNNMWISVEEETPDVDEQCLVITKNGKFSVSKMYIPKDCYGNVLGEKEWKGSFSFKESIVAWMPIPEIKKGE